MLSGRASGPNGCSLLMVPSAPRRTSSPESMSRHAGSSSMGSLAITTERTPERSALRAFSESEDCSSASRGASEVAVRSSTQSSLVAGRRTAMSSSPS